MNEEILNVIYQCVDEINDDEDQEQKLEKSLDTILLGSGSYLDSLGLVNLIVSVEQNINEKFNSSIMLADERAMTQEKSPFSSIFALSAYIQILLEE